MINGCEGRIRSSRDQEPILNSCHYYNLASIHVIRWSDTNVNRLALISDFEAHFAIRISVLAVTKTCRRVGIFDSLDNCLFWLHCLDHDTILDDWCLNQRWYVTRSENSSYTTTTSCVTMSKTLVIICAVGHLANSSNFLLFQERLICSPMSAMIITWFSSPSYQMWSTDRRVPSRFVPYYLPVGM